MDEDLNKQGKADDVIESGSLLSSSSEVELFSFHVP